jgi:hypothetical protein
MHMDESKNSIPPNELNPWSAPDPPPAVVVYCGSDTAVNQGFLIALRAMGVAVFENPAAPAKAAVTGIEP